MTRWDVLGLGAVAVDDLIYVDHYPAPNSKLPIRDRQRQGGGLAGTALVAASRLGARAAYGGVLGDDELSRFTIRELEREGVDCAPVIRRADARPFHSIVIVDRSTAQRSILYTSQGVTELAPDEISHELTSCRMLFVDHTVVASALRAVELAHQHCVPVIGDIESERDVRVHDLILHIDHLILGIDAAARLTGESEPAAMVRALASGRRACSVVTAGAQGCWYSERGGAVNHFPAFQVSAVDTNGCGDVFHGAYAACIAQGESVAQAIKVATAAAGIKATQPGGRAGIPSREALDQFLKEHHQILFETPQSLLGMVPR